MTIKEAAERYAEGAEKNRLAAEAYRDASCGWPSSWLINFILSTLALSLVFLAATLLAIAFGIVQPTPTIVNVAPVNIHIDGPTVTVSLGAK